MSQYYNLIKKWNNYASLVQSSDIECFFERHVVDCLQLCAYIDRHDKIVDVGSGAGLPGIVMGLCGYNVVLSEINNKKQAFLREVVALFREKIEIVGDIYSIDASGCVIVSRAFGSLSKLCDVMCSIGSTKGVFLKGKSWYEEVIHTQKEFNFLYDVFTSVTNNDGRIVCIDHVVRK